MKKYNKALIIFFLFTIIVITGHTQIYIGLNSAFEDVESELMLENYSTWEYSLFRKDYVYTGGYSYGIKRTHSSPYTHEFRQINYLVGKYFAKDGFLFTYQAGVGVLWGQMSEKSKFDDSYASPNKFTTIGLPLKIGVRYKFLNMFSIGADLTANVNNRKVLLMPNLSAGIGIF